MKKLQITLIFLLSFVEHINSQHNIRGMVIDGEKSPIPYTSVYNLKDSVGTYTDNNGAFHLPAKSLPVHLEFRNVGYEKKVLPIHSSKRLTIQLEEKIVVLDEVVIEKEHNISKVYNIGSQGKSKGIVGHAAKSPHWQLGLMIKNKNGALYHDAYLDRVSVKIVPPTLGGIKPNGEKNLRLRVYAISDIGKVGSDILHENIFLSPSKAGWYELELTNKISIPEKGFVLAIEWMENQEHQKWSKDTYTYGLLIDGHKLKEEELDFYLNWIFNPALHKWGYYNNGVIPCFDIILIQKPKAY